jgi:chromosomal replication initiation ATPase DnaA
VIVPLPDELGARGGPQDGGAEQPVLRRPPSIRAIILAVAEEYGISPLDVVSERRSRGITLPRQLVMYLARYFTTRSLPEIGRRLGKDHSTVLWGTRAIEGRLASVPPVEVDRTTTLAGLVRAHRLALEARR